MRRLVFIAVLLALPASLVGAANLAALEQALAQIDPGTYHREDWNWHTNYALAQLARKKARLLAKERFMGEGDMLAEKALAAGWAALARLKSGTPPPLELGQLNELAYITENDLTVQPYYLYLPPDYTPQRHWPLIIFLHGYVPTINVLDPWLPSPEQCAIAGKHGCLLLVPYGRRNTDFQGVGEIDVWHSLRQVQQAFPVDEDRLYLSGVSMGGMGAWNLALRHPGVFAAVTPICGHTDMFRWWGWPRAETPWWKRWLIEWDNALDQTPNLRNQHFFVQHGELDNLIPVEQSRLIVAAAQKQGTPIEYREHQGESHFIYFKDETFEAAWSWQKQFTRQHRPERVDFKLYSLEYNRAFWLTVEALEQWGRPGHVRAEIKPTERCLELQTENIAALKIDGPQAPLPEGCRFVWNGHSVRPKQTASGEIVLRLTKEEQPGLRKRRGLCGPCEEVFDTRFLLVQGTAGDEKADAEIARQVGLWQEEWDAFADGVPPAKLDTEITEKDIQQSNLVLFGTPRTNRVLARLAARLPIKIGEHTYEIAGKRYSGPDLGLVMCYPNPLNPARYVLIYAGERYGERLPINHKHDLLPDFLVFTTKRFSLDQANEALCAGYFGMDWQLHRELIWERSSL